MISKIRRKKIAASLITFVAIAFSPLILVPVYAQVVGATLAGRAIQVGVATTKMSASSNA